MLHRAKEGFLAALFYTGCYVMLRPDSDVVGFRAGGGFCRLRRTTRVGIGDDSRGLGNMERDRVQLYIVNTAIMTEEPYYTISRRREWNALRR